jgi:ribonuclease BN (tRNA processing enzyme)
LIIVRLTVIGCSGSFPGPSSPASSYLLEAEGFRLLLDCGNGALGSLQNFAPLDGIDAVCLSHLHGDHFLDLAAYAVVRALWPPGPLPKIPVYGPSGTPQRLAQTYGTADPADPRNLTGQAFSFPAPLREGSRDIGPFQVTAERMSHPVETWGLRFEHDGQVLAYSADTGPTPALTRLAAGADLLLCEASFVEPSGPEDPPLPPDLHLTGRQAGTHAAQASAGRLVLTHLVPWNSGDRVLAEAAESFTGPAGLAAPGLRWPG